MPQLLPDSTLKFSTTFLITLSSHTCRLHIEFISVKFRFIEENIKKLHLLLPEKIKKRYDRATSFVSDVYCIFKIILASDSLHYRSTLNLVEYLLSDDPSPISERMGK